MASPLPSPNDPVAVTRKGGKVYVALPSSAEAEQIVHKAKKRLADLPVPPDHGNPMAAVLSYEMFGLDVQDIAIAMRLTISQIVAIKQHPGYETFRKQVMMNLRDTGGEQVREYLRAKQMRAAERVGELIDSGKGNIALAAAKTVLAATGVRLDAGGDDGSPMSKGLTIIIQDAPATEPVTVEHE